MKSQPRHPSVFTMILRYDEQDASSISFVSMIFIFSSSSFSVCILILWIIFFFVKVKASNKSKVYCPFQKAASYYFLRRIGDLYLYKEQILLQTNIDTACMVSALVVHRICDKFWKLSMFSVEEFFFKYGKMLSR